MSHYWCRPVRESLLVQAIAMTKAMAMAMTTTTTMTMTHCALTGAVPLRPDRTQAASSDPKHDKNLKAISTII